MLEAHDLAKRVIARSQTPVGPPTGVWANTAVHQASLGRWRGCRRGDNGEQHCHNPRLPLVEVHERLILRSPEANDRVAQKCARP